MKWRGGRRSINVQDRRGFGRKAGRVAGGGGLAALIIIGATILFPELRGVLIGPGGTMPAPGPNDKGYVESGFDDEHLAFAQSVVGYTEDIWTGVFNSGAFPDTPEYRPATVVLFENRTQSGCGFASAQSGPFYCPADETVFIDPSFYKLMEQQFGVKGDFAAAYVIAHEIAHHVQKVTGQLERAYSVRLRGSQIEANRATVRIELQADCYAGLWARQTEEAAGVLEEGDIQEALRAAHQVGDDVIQRMSGQPIDETAFTHGSAEQRMRWFMKGFKSGEVAACDTFTPAYDQL